MRPSAGSQRPALHEQLLISRNPHTPTRPSFAHCDCTAAGSTGLSLLTQAGIAPQQLPTFLTVQPLSVLQPYSIVGASRTRLGGNGRDIDGGALAGRKSVVSGKSGAVSVDLGGRRSIKKKCKSNI